MPNVLVERCRVDFGDAPEDWIETNGGCWRFRVRDCFRWDGAPVEDHDIREAREK